MKVNTVGPQSEHIGQCDTPHPLIRRNWPSSSDCVGPTTPPDIHVHNYYCECVVVCKISNYSDDTPSNIHMFKFYHTTCMVNII